jgi:hypothetical protein
VDWNITSLEGLGRRKRRKQGKGWSFRSSQAFCDSATWQLGQLTEVLLIVVWHFIMQLDRRKM